MDLTGLAIRALDGSALIEGRLGIHSGPKGPAAEAGPGCLIGVTLRGTGLGRTAFAVFDTVRRGDDGFHGAGPPLLSVAFEEGVPDLVGLLGRSAGGRLRIDSDGFRAVSASFRGGEDRQVHAHGGNLSLALAVEPQGVRIAFEGLLRLAGEAPDTQGAAEVMLVGDLLAPAGWCMLQGFAGLRFSGVSREVVGPWKALGPGLGGVAVDIGGSPFCPGTLALGGPAGEHVLLHLRERELVAVPAGRLERLASGFAQAAATSGGRLRLNQGHADWAEMIGRDDAADVTLSGPGIGHIDGMIGRAAPEDGPQERAIARLGLRLDRRAEGLRVLGEGELADGAALRFDFVVPGAWMLARGLRIAGLHEARRAAFPSGDGG